MSCVSCHFGNAMKFSQGTGGTDDVLLVDCGGTDGVLLTDTGETDGVLLVDNSATKFCCQVTLVELTCVVS